MTAGNVPARHAHVGPHPPIHGRDRSPGLAEGERIQESVCGSVVDLPGGWRERADGREQKEEIQLAVAERLLQNQRTLNLRREHASSTLASLDLQRPIFDQARGMDHAMNVAEALPRNS